MGGELISTEELAQILHEPNVRIFDCTTRLDYQPPGSDVPYIPVPGLDTFTAGHIPGADFLDIQGEFSDQRTNLHFMMEWIAYDQFAGPFHKSLHESLVNRCLYDDARAAQAYFALVGKSGLQGGGQGEVKVTICEDHGRVLTSHFE